ncbi:hypothetical protein JYK14_08225 [Siccirubricoccus sp. KC 17139]|uniref:DUF222 domain-containing protein n=1 Tax=Siccirubricoccus soli TaxID=2899147 RepID=A0ABT1D2I9_9PROT|nr:hypothetical protein [Siccirubricoccus soli]MCO6416152.1 hypothetical protein [Siccirubricoccus soli]MCP2682286.1 hypothetical protein [Siccirubricoccus soli]
MVGHGDVGQAHEKEGASRTGAAAPATRTELEQAARVALRHDFHEPSKTHIVWCPGIGRGAAKGFGDAADEALRMFRRRLKELLDTAAPSDLERWRHNLAQDQAERLREALVRSLAARERVGEYSLGLDPSQTALLAGEPGSVPSNERIVEALREGLAILRAAARDRTLDEMRAAVADHERALREGRRDRGDAPVYRTVRMDAETHARLQLQAHEIGVKLQELCRHLLGLHLHLHGLAPAEGDVGTTSAAAPSDPFANLDRAAFAKVAKATRMRKAVLAAIRDGRVVNLPLVVAARIGAAMPVPVPANDVVGHAASGAQLPPAMAARAVGKPTAGERGMTLEEVARDAGMSAEEIKEMLSE